MPRWTVRGVTPEAIKAVQHVQDAIGASLGEIVSACIETGLPEVLRRLPDDYTGANLASATDDMAKLQRLIWVFQHGPSPGSSSHVLGEK